MRFYYRPFVYLDVEAIAGAGHDPDVVRETIADALGHEPGIHLAVSREGLDRHHEPELAERIRNNFHATRAGDIYVVQTPYWFNFDEGPVAVMHGSPSARGTC